MMNTNDEALMSHFVDGELPSDQANALLLSVLDHPESRETLKDLLRLRQATEEWRSKSPARPVLVVAPQPIVKRRTRGMWRAGSMALAACVGGLLVLTGIWAAGGFRGGPAGAGPGKTEQVLRVSADQIQHVATAFELHESVAGPLAWYADDEQNIRVAAAKPTDARRTPVGVLLRLASSDPNVPARTLVIVCRQDQPAVIDLPRESGGRDALRVCLTPREVDGGVQMQYAIAMDGATQEPLATLSGQRNLGLTEASLGQLAADGKLLSIEAAAWPLRPDRK